MSYELPKKKNWPKWLSRFDANWRQGNYKYRLIYKQVLNYSGRRLYQYNEDDFRIKV